MTVYELSCLDGFSAITVSEPEREITGVYIGDLLSWVMGRAKADDVWITIMSNINTVAVASLSDVACILLAEDVKLEESVRTTAEAKGINVLSCEYSAFEAAKLLAQKCPEL